MVNSLRQVADDRIELVAHATNDERPVQQRMPLALRIGTHRDKRIACHEVSAQFVVDLRWWRELLCVTWSGHWIWLNFTFTRECMGIRECGRATQPGVARHPRQRDNRLLYGLERLAGQAGSAKTWYVGDAFSSVRLTLSDTGTLLGVVNYDPWGRLESDIVPMYRYVRVAESDSGLVNLAGARLVDPRKAGLQTSGASELAPAQRQMPALLASCRKVCCSAYPLPWRKD